MPIEQRELHATFKVDLQAIVVTLLQQFGVRHTRSVSNLSDPLLRWLDFTLRYIEPRPRRITPSSLFPKQLPDNVASSLQYLEKLLLAGENINPYQGRGLTRFHDTSGTARHNRTDLLWADWGIHHLHLVNTPPRPGSVYSDRSNWLLYCLVLRDEIGFIDVRPHGKGEAFSDPSLLRQILKDWPLYMEQFRLHGILPSREALSAQTIMRSREAGVVRTIEHAGAVYLGPGLGVTTAATPLRATRACDAVHEMLRMLVQEVACPDAQFLRDMCGLGIALPRFRLQLTSRGLAVYEEISETAFVLPRSSPERTSYLAELHDVLVPTWIRLEQ